jgi:type I restriction enzyme M protein
VQPAHHSALADGIFYAQGVKTNVLFFQRGTTRRATRKAVWIYDMRTNMPSFGKRIPLTPSTFKPSGSAMGMTRTGTAARRSGEEGRFRCFTREQITKRGENLDLSWLRDESLQSGDDLPEPEVIATEIMEKLRIATKGDGGVDGVTGRGGGSRSSECFGRTANRRIGGFAIAAWPKSLLSD